MTTGGIIKSRFVAGLVAIAVAASACTGSATVTQTGTTAASGAEQTEATSEQAEPTAPPAPAPTSAATAETPGAPTPTATPTGPPPTLFPDEAFLVETITGLSADGAHAYAGVTSPWNNPTACDATPAESLVVVDVVDAEAGSMNVVGAGLEQAGDVVRMVFHKGGSAAILSSCGPFDGDRETWLQRADFGPDGRIVSVGERLQMQVAGEGDPFLVGWIDEDTIEIRATIEVDPDDFESWLIDRRRLSITTGEILSSEQSPFYSDEGIGVRQEFTTRTGTYRVVDDPEGRLGCEGFGVAVTLELVTGSDAEPALTQPDLVFSGVQDFHVSEDGYVAWSSGCEGFVSAFAGRVQDDGTIADAHLIETFNFFTDTFADFYHYRLSTDGHLHAVGQSFDPDSDAESVAFLRYSLRADPHFVNTADPAPQIDSEPLFIGVDGTGTWHVGDTLATDPACGARTLYAQTPGGFLRAFPIGVEMDTIVDVDLGETRRISFPDGDFVSRTVVVQTECPGEYEGRRVWFGVESDNIIWGLLFDRADLGEVADVISVRDVVQDGSDFVDTSIVQVQLLDGSLAEIELVRLPGAN